MYDATAAAVCAAHIEAAQDRALQQQIVLV